MQTKLRILAVIAILAVISSAQQTPAQTPAKTPAKPATTTAKKPAAATGADSEARHKMALGLIHLLMPKEHTDQMIAQIDQQFVYAAAADYKRRGLTIPQDFESKMKAALAGMVTYDEVTSWAADFYAQHFTTAEMRQMETFYNAPTGRKLIQAQPEIGQETMRKLLVTVDQRLPAAMKKEGLNPPEPRTPGQGANPNPTAPPAQQEPPPK